MLKTIYLPNNLKELDTKLPKSRYNTGLELSFDQPSQ